MGNSIAAVADPMGHLHVFYASQPSSSSTPGIDYTYWDGERWSEPNSIIVNADGSELYGIRAVIDQQQVVHLIYRHGDGQHRHTSAPLANAGLANAWSQPTVIVPTFYEADIAVGRDNSLFVAFADPPASGTVSIVRSTDGGSTWASPVKIASVDQPNSAPNEVRLAIDATGRMHAVWTEYELPNGWPPTGAFYARSTDGGQTWETPVQIAKANHGQIGVGSVGQDEIHLVWRSTVGGDGTFHQYSRDGGRAWSVPDRYDDAGGFSGLPSFAVDGSGRMHYVVGAVKHAMWDGNGLSQYEDVAGNEAKRLFPQLYSQERGVIAITSGNLVHVLWETNFKSLWHASKQLDLPAIPTVTAVPTGQRAPVETTAPKRPALPQRTITPAPLVVPPPFPEEPRGLSTELVMLAGALPALIIVGIVLISRSRKK